MPCSTLRAIFPTHRTAVVALLFAGTSLFLLVIATINLLIDWRDASSHPSLTTKPVVLPSFQPIFQVCMRPKALALHSRLPGSGPPVQLMDVLVSPTYNTDVYLNYDPHIELPEDELLRRRDALERGLLTESGKSDTRVLHSRLTFYTGEPGTSLRRLNQCVWFKTADPPPIGTRGLRVFVKVTVATLNDAYLPENFLTPDFLILRFIDPHTTRLPPPLWDFDHAVTIDYNNLTAAGVAYDRAERAFQQITESNEDPGSILGFDFYDVDLVGTGKQTLHDDRARFAFSSRLSRIAGWTVANTSLAAHYFNVNESDWAFREASLMVHASSVELSVLQEKKLVDLGTVAAALGGIVSLLSVAFNVCFPTRGTEAREARIFSLFHHIKRYALLLGACCCGCATTQYQQRKAHDERKSWLTFVTDEVDAQRTAGQSVDLAPLPSNSS